MAPPNIIKMLRSGEVSLPPLEITLVSLESPDGSDATIEARWRENSCWYVVAYKSNAKPQTLRMAIDQIKRFAERSNNLLPMVIVPYLSDEKLDMLSCEGVSGIDLCGNGIVEAPGFSVSRTGNPNRYPDSDSLRSAYRGDTSLVARAMLLRDTFESVGDILELIEARGGGLAMSTVSKALKKLEEDLVINRTGTPAVAVVDREKILDQLAQNDRPAKQQAAWTGRIELPDEALQKRVDEIAGRQSIIRTGMGSARAYVTFKGEPLLEVYTTAAIGEVLDQLAADAKETRAFPNLRLIQTDDQRVFFDARPGLIASPIQTWLEMAGGDKRSREAAETLRDALIRGEEAVRGG